MSSQTSAAATASPAVTDGMRVFDPIIIVEPPTVYLMINQRGHQVSAEVAEKNLFGNTDATPVDNLHITIGAPIGDGYLAKSPGAAAVYLVYDGFKRWIPSPGVFDQFGFAGNLIREVPAGELNAIPNGPDVG